jgi:hypothetical protein
MTSFVENDLHGADTARSSAEPFDMDDASDMQRVADASSSSETSDSARAHLDTDHAEEEFGDLNNLQIPQDQLDHQTTPPVKTSKGLMGWAIGGGLFMVLIVGGLGWAAMTVLGGHEAKDQVVSAPPSLEEIRAQKSTKSVDDISKSLTASLGSAKATDKNSEALHGMAVRTALGATQTGNQTTFTSKTDPSEVSSDAPADPQAKVPDSLGVRKGESTDIDPVTVRGDQSVMTSEDGQDVSLTGTSLSEEEKTYDRYLEQIPTKSIPPEAIKIDQSVVNRQLTSTQVARLTEAVATQQQGLKAVNESMSGMQSTVSGIGQAVAEIKQMASNQAEAQTASAKQMAAFQSELQASVAKNDAEVKELKAEVARLMQSQRADVAQSSQQPKAAREAPAAPAPKPQKAAAAQTFARAGSASRAQEAPAVSPTQVLSKAESAPPVVTAADTRNDQPKTVACSSKTVSSVWRIKGVTHSQAYLVRVEDGFGAYVEENSEVPGFGTVRSFDPMSRSVCTTFGIIKR